MINTELNGFTAVEKLLAIMKMLRDKEYGCPWDLEQTIESLASYTLEEVYEVVDAIEQGDRVQLEDELGDLLFQVVFYAQLAEEEGHFNFDDIATVITNKLIRRHPHVFPDGQVEKFGASNELSADQVVVNWEAIKEQERADKILKGGVDKARKIESILDDVALALPALERARKIQNRAANVGFDWDDVAPVIAKVKEELMELEQAMAASHQGRIDEEFGDLLFATVNLSRHLKIEPEKSLRRATQKFESRFRYMESRVLAGQQNIRDLGLQELDRLWDAAKALGH